MAITRKGFAPLPKSHINDIAYNYKDFARADRQYSKTHGGKFATPANLVNLGVERQRQAPNLDSAASAGIGILGAASLAASSLVPVAAAAGIGYGVYKLGESFKLW